MFLIQVLLCDGLSISNGVGPDTLVHKKLLIPAVAVLLLPFNTVACPTGIAASLPAFTTVLDVFVGVGGRGVAAVVLVRCNTGGRPAGHAGSLRVFTAGPDVLGGGGGGGVVVCVVVLTLITASSVDDKPLLSVTVMR